MSHFTCLKYSYEDCEDINFLCAKKTFRFLYIIPRFLVYQQRGGVHFMMKFTTLLRPMISQHEIQYQAVGAKWCKPYLIVFPTILLYILLKYIIIIIINNIYSNNY